MPVNRSRRACEREIVEELDTSVRVGAEIHHVAHEYPERIVELHFFRCELLGEPRPVLGQEMRWVARERARVAGVSAGRCGVDCDARRPIRVARRRRVELTGAHGRSREAA